VPWREIFGDSPCVTESVSWEQSRSAHDGTAVLNDINQISFAKTGRTPTNEDNALDVCARLVRWLNATGADWSDPIAGTDDVDGYSTNSRCEKLQMQVSRASHGDGMWRNLNRKGSVNVESDTENAANEIIDRVRKKSAKYPLTQRKALTLVVDASRTPGHTFQPVFDRFRCLHFEECKSSGFAQVWVVGAIDELIVRLDQ
jgi:hypothetical protein